MENNKWLEASFNAVHREIKEVRDMMKNHLHHHFAFTMGALAAATAIGLALLAYIMK